MSAYCSILPVLLVLTFTTPSRAYGPFDGFGDLKIARPEDKEHVKSMPPPRGAIVLFDGKGLDNWAPRSGKGPAPWRVLRGGELDVKFGSGDVVTKQKFAGKFKLHVEFRVGYEPKATGQRRGNSGVYLQGRYEVQVLDSYGQKKRQKDDCGAIYSIAAPLANVCKAPTIWQSFDVEFQAPTCKDGKKVGPAIATVYHNGTKIHDKVLIATDNTLRGLGGSPCAPGPILLQENGCAVQFRNIWLLPLDK